MLLGALAHTTRLRIVELLVGGERTVNDVAALLCLRRITASRRRRVLASAGLLAVEQRGSSRFYRLSGPRVAQVVALIGEYFQVHYLRGADPVSGQPRSSEDLLQPLGALSASRTDGGS